MPKKFLYKKNLTISGLNVSLINEYILNYYNTNDGDVLIVSDSLYEANNIYKGIHRLCSDVYFFPVDEFITLSTISSSPDLKIARIDTLNKIEDINKKIIVTNLSGYLKYIDKKVNKLHVNLKLTRKELISFLEENSYIKTNLVTTTGEYAVRSFIIDVFPINSDSPVRFEFFDEEMESIRLFNPETQISESNVEEFELYSFTDESKNDKENIVDKLNNPFVFFLDYKKILNSYNFFKESDIQGISNIKDLFNNLEKMNLIDKMYINSIDDSAVEDEIKIYSSKDIINFENNYDRLCKYVYDNIKQYIIIFMIKNQNLINKIISLFGNDISINNILDSRVNILNRDIEKGYIFGKYLVISEFDIENINKKGNFINHYSIGRKIKGFEDLKIDDYVVHVVHGIGQYKGLTTIEKNGIKKDYLLIKYADSDKIYIPAQKIETIYKYGDSDIKVPKLNNLSSNNWIKTKTKVRNKIRDISGELIELYAKRELSIGESYKEFPEEVIFANDFEYEETDDQKKCIKEILHDLSDKKPMDRLLCGDVGFGKTEVAMRAMFRTVMNNRQVAYLCPTTILSKQQYENAKKRFRHFPVNIELVNRFTSQKDLSRICSGLENGTVDILIGTHKLFNDKIKFKHLGLLVIDEEQRFGVTQKEKIKKLKNNINILSLSATPIPRTLKLAMGGVKDLSILDTAPINRYPIQTYVIEENDYLIKEAIYKELSRNGQVYILNNNIENLDIEYEKIMNLVPEAKVCIAHGKMDKNKLNKVINSYVNGEYNILLCTTIIESGIDIPNVNTLIVKNADRFGLSQLYQIRGRVGRSDRIAYAYMMYEKNKMLNDVAIKRLKTIKDFTELGSGYKIAMRDLSIRGAGELLGANQSGFVDLVGIDLYMDMINEEICKIKGIETNTNKDNDKSYLDISTSISKEYVDDESLRIEIHKLINKINSKETFNEVKNEIEDRFGKVNEDIINYMYEEWFQSEIEALDINNVRYIANNVEVEIPENISSKVDGEKLFLKIYSINPKFKIKYFNKMLYISLNIINRNGDYVKDLLDMIILLKDCIK